MVSLRERIANDEFIRLEAAQASRLARVLANESREDLLADVRLYALEAADSYDPDLSAFQTWLTTHTRQRCMSQANRANAKKRKGNCVCLVMDPEGQRRNLSRCLEIAELLTALSDPSRRLLSVILHCHDETLCAAFRSKHRLARVSRLLEIERERVAEFVEELRREIPKFLSS